MMELTEYLADAEIMRAIRYLDPDLCAEKAEQDPVRSSELASPC
jgi:hypothetical protein